MTQCTFCNHRDAAILERQIATKQLNQVQAAMIIGCNKSTISRHMANCVPKKIAEWVKPKPAKEETINVVTQLVRSHEELLQLYQAARAKEDIHAAIKVLEAERRHLELVAKLTGQLQEATQVSFLLNPQYLTLKQTLIRILEPHPELRQEVSQALIDAEEGLNNGKHNL
jgi:poly-D-alanine transfer protein DltD